ncbi:MAG: DUF1059 domain-containing protein [Halolamina sp.]
MAREFSCNDCGFMVRSDDDDEVIDFVKQHADHAHGRQVADDDVRAGWEEVQEADD